VTFGVTQVQKVYAPRASFTGCLFNVIFNDDRLSLWPSVLGKQSQPVCCKKPGYSFPAAAPTVSPAVTFYGFGYLFLDNFLALSQFSNQLGVRLKFRTFAPDALILLIADATLADPEYWVIFLSDGKLRAHVADVAAGASTLVESQQTYNTGDWFQVHAGSFSPV